LPKFNRTAAKGATAYIEEKILRASNLKIDDEFYAIVGDKQIILRKLE
jgi:hypothetical protein